ncbi:hypothetical protein HOLleu_32575 [Holothuria leucospilota]|uniref:Uncharacterized protein n=1 Tax=Holothuria leucospilota TaxID=206669 RepID=A0A9Q1BIW7_HOLLE|nr:hypothetical protein HOLleu_32575 [Holothuria leucospilota]
MTDVLLHKIMIYLCAALFLIERGNSRPTEQSGTLAEGDDTSHVECNCFVNLNGLSFFVNPKESVCVPVNVAFDITCTLQEETDATIDRHKQRVEGVLTTAGSNMFSDAICQWEDNGNSPQCSLTFDNRSYHSTGTKVILIEIMYQTIFKTVSLEVYDAEKEHPVCNPSRFTTSVIPSTRTQEITEHRVTKSISLSTKSSNVVHIADNPNRQNGSTLYVNNQLLIIAPACVVILIVIILVVLFTRKWRTRRHRDYVTNLPVEGAVEQYEMESSELQGNAEGHG